MKITPTQNLCGAYVSDLTLSQITAEDVHEIKQAMALYGVLFFRNQPLTSEQQTQLAQQLGGINSNQHNELDKDDRFNKKWRTNRSYEEQPPMGSILIAPQHSESRISAQFLNLAQAYQRLPEILRQAFRGWSATHSNAHLQNQHSVSNTIHPVVIKHPVSDEPVLYVNPTYSSGLNDKTYDESQNELKKMYKHVIKASHITHFEWEQDSVAICDHQSSWYLNQDDSDLANNLKCIQLSGTRLEGY